ncbi:MAG: PD40 domain-containing protein [Planctomycetes bacterium]|nr:PD40 domain-containing protein [Planctomycetota bacterium]
MVHRLSGLQVRIAAFLCVVLGAAVHVRAQKEQDTHSEAPVLTNIRQLTNADMGFARAGEAYFSPDGKSIIFQAVPIGQEHYQIYTLPTAGGSPTMVSTGRGACTCAYFHPNGKKIIFASSHLDPDLGKVKEKEEETGGYKWFFNEHMDIFEANLDGSNLHRLTDTPGYDAEGTFSSDGRQIVFTSRRDGDLEIYVMDADGGNQRRMTHGKGYDGGPFFSPNGKTIIYRGDRRNDGKMNLQLRTVNTDGGNDRAITDNPVFNWCPYWYPSGKCFIFTQVDHEAWSKGRAPNYDLFMMTPEGRNLTRITFAPAFDGLPAFSPDGKRLIWTSKRGGLTASQIFMAQFSLPQGFE